MVPIDEPSDQLKGFIVHEATRSIEIGQGNEGLPVSE